MISAAKGSDDIFDERRMSAWARCPVAVRSANQIRPPTARNEQDSILSPTVAISDACGQCCCRIGGRMNYACMASALALSGRERCLNPVHKVWRANRSAGPAHEADGPAHEPGPAS